MTVQLEEPWILPDSTWDPALFVTGSVRHPAKMNRPMVGRIFDLYHREGMVVCDPMSGIGTVLVEGMTRGSPVFGTEIEPEFFDLALQNLHKTQKATGEDRWELVCADWRSVDMDRPADLIITSPPYADSLKGGIGPNGHSLQAGWTDRISYLRAQNRWQRDRENNMATYSSNPENIGNLDLEGYEAAMKEIYFRCAQVLREDGRMVVVVKSILRDWKVVPIASMTIAWMESVGFTLEHVHKRAIARPSAGRMMSMAQWRIKFPGVEYPITTEEILVFSRTSSPATREDGREVAAATSPPFSRGAGEVPA